MAKVTRTRAAGVKMEQALERAAQIAIIVDRLDASARELALLGLDDLAEHIAQGADKLRVLGFERPMRQRSKPTP
jgi:hypothetical protein